MLDGNTLKYCGEGDPLRKSQSLEKGGNKALKRNQETQYVNKLPFRVIVKYGNQSDLSPELKFLWKISSTDLYTYLGLFYVYEVRSKIHVVSNFEYFVFVLKRVE